MTNLRQRLWPFWQRHSRQSASRSQPWHSNYNWWHFAIKRSYVCFCVDAFGEPLEDGRLSLRIDSEAHCFFHRAVDDRLCDAALLATSRFLLCFRSPAVFRWGRGGTSHIGSQPAVTVWGVLRKVSTNDRQIEITHIMKCQDSVSVPKVTL